jgi:Skp family chaperone for outer membrane proteins
MFLFQTSVFAQESEDNETTSVSQKVATTYSPTIAIVDLDLIAQESIAAKGVRAMADKFQQTFKNEMSKEEAKLQSTQQSIEEQRKTLSEEAFVEKVQAFESTVAEFQKKNMAQRQALEKSFNTSMNRIQEEMIEIAKQIAAKYGITMVMQRSQVIVLDESLDITKELIGIINKKLPHVDFSAPKVDAESVPSNTGSKKHSK